MNAWTILPETSAAQGLTVCNKCGVCCHKFPCLLVPGDAERIAEKMGMSLQTFLGHTRIEKTPEDRWLVRMRPTCVFLLDNQCTIHDFKPSGGRDFECWSEDTFSKTYFWTETELAALWQIARN